MKKILKLFLSSILLFLVRIVGRKGIAILEYHRISEDIQPEDVHSIYPSEFYSQIKYLAKTGYEFISINELIKLLLKKEIKNNKYVAITFDDGHKDIFKYAYPILKKFKAKATVFIISDYVGKKGWLSDLGELKKSKTSGAQKWDLLSWNELEQMRDCFFIESHSKSHKHMDGLMNSSLEKELLIPIKIIMEKINYYPSIFCYPFGDYNLNVIEKTKISGYIGACSSKSGINIPNKTDIWQLKRNEVGRGLSKIQFKLLLNEGFSIYNHFSKFYNKLIGLTLTKYKN